MPLKVKTVGILWLAACVLLVLQGVMAKEYVGDSLIWTVEDLQLTWNDTKCVTYHVYNPTASPITARLSASGTIAQFVKSSSSVYLTPNTTKARAMPIDLCFGGFTQIEKTYTGTIQVNYDKGTFSGEAPLVIKIVEPKATKFMGVGLTWHYEILIIETNRTKCIQYELYNPFDFDVEANLQANGDVKPLVMSVTPQTVSVKAKTFKDEGIPVQMCFQWPKEGTYSGGVVAAYKVKSFEGSGSQVGASVQASLSITVKNPPPAIMATKQEAGLNLMELSLWGGVIVAVAFVGIYLVRR